MAFPLKVEYLRYAEARSAHKLETVSLPLPGSKEVDWETQYAIVLGRLYVNDWELQPEERVVHPRDWYYTGANIDPRAPQLIVGINHLELIARISILDDGSLMIDEDFSDKRRGESEHVSEIHAENAIIEPEMVILEDGRVYAARMERDWQRQRLYELRLPVRSSRN